MRRKPEDPTQKIVRELLGLSFWRRNWWLTMGLLTLPIPLTVGFITGEYPFNHSEIVPPAQMIVGFASFLSATWTFGLAYFWPSLEREARRMRTLVMRIKPPNGADLLEALKGLRLPFWSFLLAMLGLMLIIWSAFLAVGGALYGFGLFVLLSMWTLAFGFMLTIGIWVQLYLARDALSRLNELIPPVGQ